MPFSKPYASRVSVKLFWFGLMVDFLIFLFYYIVYFLETEITLFSINKIPYYRYATILLTYLWYTIFYFDFYFLLFLGKAGSVSDASSFESDDFDLEDIVFILFESSLYGWKDFNELNDLPVSGFRGIESPSSLFFNLPNP